MEALKPHHQAYFDAERKMEAVKSAYIQFDMAEYGGEDVTLYLAALARQVALLQISLNQMLETTGASKPAKHLRLDDERDTIQHKIQVYAPKGRRR